MSDPKIVSAKIILGKEMGDHASVMVMYSTRQKEQLLTYYEDEMSFVAADFLGLTKEEGCRLFLKKDTANLRS